MPSYTVMWLLAGAVLCLTELFLPSAFVSFLMGISALVVALLSGVGLVSLWLQVVVWLVLSILLVLGSRRFGKPLQRRSKIQDATIAQTLTEITPGRTGRVLYEGNSWQARCDDEKLGIALDERVYVVRREGTTLIIMPENFLNS